MICLTIFRASSPSMPEWKVRVSRTESCVASSIFPRFRRVHGDAALGHLLLEDLDDRLELPLVVGQQGQRILLLVVLDRGARPLEVVAHRDLVLRLGDGVVHLDLVDLAHDVERMIVGHGSGSRFGRFGRSSDMASARRSVIIAGSDARGRIEGHESRAANSPHSEMAPRDRHARLRRPGRGDGPDALDRAGRPGPLFREPVRLSDPQRRDAGLAPRPRAMGAGAMGRLCPGRRLDLPRADQRGRPPDPGHPRDLAGREVADRVVADRRRVRPFPARDHGSTARSSPSASRWPPSRCSTSPSGPGSRRRRDSTRTTRAIATATPWNRSRPTTSSSWATRSSGATA